MAANDNVFAPLSLQTARALNDKIYEKRKGAALEIEKMVKELIAANKTAEINQLMGVLSKEFALSHNPHARKGGLIALAATAIALGKACEDHLSFLIQPVLSCFYDQDSRVRYYACEALYNIVKVARGAILSHFNQVFDGLSRLAADPDLNVKSGSELLDRIMKDIVTEDPHFDLVTFVPLLRERVYTPNSFARQFIVSWICVLDSVPEINLLVFLPEFLDGMFHILGDQNKEIRKMCDSTLNEFLLAIKKNPTSVDIPSMVNILITHSQSQDDLLQYTALVWLREFLGIAGRSMLPFVAGILTAILPCLAYEDAKRKSINEAAKTVNLSLMRLVTAEDDKDAGEDVAKEAPKQPPTTNDSQEDQHKNLPNLRLDLGPLVEVMTKQLLNNAVQTRLAVLNWIYHLQIKTPNKIFRHVEEIFPVLMKTLSDPSDEVILLVLEVLAEVASSPAGVKRSQKPSAKNPPQLQAPESGPSPPASLSLNTYFDKLMCNLAQIFSSDSQLLEDRGSFIIRQLCLLLNAEDIYKSFSEILVEEKGMKFASTMVQTLNSILLTATELFELRNQLKELKTKESCDLFVCLYKSWCHSPIATVSLCFLTQNYQHICHLLHLFGDLEVTVDFLTQIDKLVQLIESPIFTYLRLQLLEVEENHYLVKSLYGLLMLLPQSMTFDTLRHRLDCVPNIQKMPPKVADHKNKSKLTSPKENPRLSQIDFNKLILHFKFVQEKHTKAKRPKTRNIDEIMRKLEY